jgi:hypothetical protein
MARNWTSGSRHQRAQTRRHAVITEARDRREQGPPRDFGRALAGFRQLSVEVRVFSTSRPFGRGHGVYQIGDV